VLRGKSGRVFGNATGLFVSIKGIPSTYNKDLQESVEPMLDTCKTVSDSIQIANGVLATMELRPDRMRAALDPFMLATDLADALVRAGVPFRETHEISGRCVALSEQTGTPMNELTYEQLKSVDARFKEDISEVFDYEKSVEMRTAKGGTSKATVLEQIEVLKKILA
jgi:argininosuccinate lyase